MRKHWPVRQPFAMPWTLEAPLQMTGYDAVQIQVSLTPSRGTEEVPNAAAHARVWITTLEAEDIRALEYLARQLVDHVMREWHKAK